MSSSFNPRANLSEENALRIIRDILDYGTVHYSKHSRDSMNLRNFSDQDIINVLETGNIIDKEFNEEQGNWKYKISGVDIDGDDGSVVTAVLTAHSQIIITAF